MIRNPLRLTGRLIWLQAVIARINAVKQLDRQTGLTALADIKGIFGTLANRSAGSAAHEKKGTAVLARIRGSLYSSATGNVRVRKTNRLLKECKIDCRPRFAWFPLKTRMCGGSDLDGCRQGGHPKPAQTMPDYRLAAHGRCK
jgi:hypothetical protein